jgi:hypothetical protein
MPEDILNPTTTRAQPGQGRKTTLIDRALLVALLVNLVALLLYIGLSYKFAFHSDSAAANLLAQEIIETGDYFPVDWNYVNGDLWVLFVQTWLLPFLPFLPNGYALHAIGGLIGAGLVLASTWCVCRTLGLSARARLVALVLMASGFSANMSENLFGQQSYGTVYFMGCFILCASHAFLYARGRRAWIWAAAVFVLFLLVAWSNPHRAAIYNILPVILAAVWCHARFRRQPHPARGPGLATLAALLLVVVGAFYVGTLLHAYFLARGHSNLAGVSINWLAFNDMGRNAGAALHGMLSLLSGLPVPGRPVANVVGLLDAMRLTAGAVLLGLSGWALLRNLGSVHPGRLFMGVAVLGAIGSNLFIFLTTTLPFAGTPESSIRYLVPGLLGMIVLLVAVVVDDRLAHPAKRYAGGVAIAVIAATAPMAYELPALAQHASIRDLNHANQNVRLANFLIDNKLEYGYATFWHAGRTTVLAKHAVKVRNIELDNGLPRAMRHLSSDRWYMPSAWVGPSFLLLTKDEVSAVNWPVLKQLTGEPLRTLSFENFEVVVFDHNIARDFPSWSVRVEGQLSYPALPTSAHEVGKYDPVARALVAEPGTSGTLHFGPYQGLEGGRYLVSFDIETEGKDVADFGRVDVVADSGKHVFGAQSVTVAGAQRITLPVAFDGFVRGLEFRVFTSGGGKFMLRNIEVTKQGDPGLISKVKPHAGQ